MIGIVSLDFPLLLLLFLRGAEVLAALSLTPKGRVVLCLCTHLDRSGYAGFREGVGVL